MRIDETQLSASHPLTERDGDPVGVALERYRGYLLAIARQELPVELGGKIGASDLVQETLLLGYRELGTFRGATEQQLVAWLRRILLNQLQNTLKAYHTDKRNIAREQVLESWMDQPTEGTPSAVAVSREECEALERALEQLPDAQRRVIVMRHRENRTFADIAQTLGCSESSVRFVWVSAIEALQARLEEHASQSK